MVCEERSGEAISTRGPVNGWPKRPDRPTEPAAAGLKDTAETIALVAAIVAAVAAPAGCSNSDCAYYGDPDTNTRCVVVGPSPADGEE